MLISEGQNIAIKSAEMVLSDLTWKSVKKGPPVIRPAVGDHKGQGRVSGERPVHAACVDAPPTTSCHGGVGRGAPPNAGGSAVTALQRGARSPRRLPAALPSWDSSPSPLLT